LSRAPSPRLGRRALGGLVALALAAALVPGRANANESVTATATATAAELQRAQAIVEGRCFICHGVEGESSSPVFPRLAGQHAAYIARQLADYASGRRSSSAMQPMVEGLGPADFEALGRWFESRSVRPHPVADPELAQVGRFIYLRGNADSGVPACASCHGPAAQGSATLPRLAGQHAQYTERQLRQFGQRARSNDQAVMHAVASRLTELEAKAVASYLSGLP